MATSSALQTRAGRTAPRVLVGSGMRKSAGSLYRDLYEFLLL
jgi:hypothetical protein